MSQKKYLISIDQSTTTTKLSLYLFNGTLIDKQIIPHQQISKQQGWLQHNPNQIINNIYLSITNLIIKIKLFIQQFNINDILGLGLCNQRQTIICWDINTQQPLYNAIVWCDSRTKNICQKFKNTHGNFTHKTGLPVSTYFSMFKIMWLLENVQGLKQKVNSGLVRFGTIDTWVTLKLTGKYVTDASNASRTHLMDITTGKWDHQLLQLAGITQACLPQIINSFQQVGDILQGDLKGVPLMCILGDQQSSAYAHNLTQTQMKITYGTGCFMLNNIGHSPIFDQSFVTTILSQDKGIRQYGFQVAVECGGGTINWAKKLHLFNQYSQLNHLPQRNCDIYFIPSFGTIFSPFWQNNVKGGLIGINFNTTKQHILRSILDSITFRLFDNIKNQKFVNLKKIIVDGGMTVNPQFLQLQSDMFNKQIQVCTLDTCWGVAKGVLKTQNLLQNIKQFQTQLYQPNKNQHDHLLQIYTKWNQTRNIFYGWKHK